MISEFCLEIVEHIKDMERTLTYKPTHFDDSQCTKTFKSMCMINGKVYKLVIDICSCEKMFSNKLAEYLKLKTKPYPTPFSIGWIKKSLSIGITE